MNHDLCPHTTTLLFLTHTQQQQAGVTTVVVQQQPTIQNVVFRDVPVVMTDASGNKVGLIMYHITFVCLEYSRSPLCGHVLDHKCSNYSKELSLLSVGVGVWGGSLLSRTLRVFVSVFDNPGNPH